MKKAKIIIADEEPKFCFSLLQGLIEIYHDHADIEVITDPTYYKDLFSNPQRADILVISESFYDSSIVNHDISHVILLNLSNKNSVSDRIDVDNVTSVFRGAGIKSIVKVITSFAPLKGNTNEFGTKIICVCSAGGGVGKTTLSMALSLSLAQNYKKKVLYINAGYFHSFQRLLDNKNPISNTTYKHLFTDNKSIYADIKDEIRKEGFFYIPPFKASLMSLNIDFSIYGSIIRSAKESKDYDYIVVDSDAPFDNCFTDFIGMSDNVIFVLKATPSSMYSTKILVSNISGISTTDKYLFTYNDFVGEPDEVTSISPANLPYTISGLIEHIEGIDKLTLKEISKEPGIQKLSVMV